jgi:hypothetical protein|tara:strand:- start:524 stop:1033 length:510 start_codon:yes stop_codon:yes gene_type:complete
MMRFNILYTDYKEEQIYRRSIKCDINENDTTYYIKYSNRHITSKQMSSTIEKSFNVDERVIEYIDTNGNSNYRINLLLTNDIAIYTNMNLNKKNDTKIDRLLQHISNIIFINIPKNDCRPEKLNIMIDNNKLDDLIETYDYELMTTCMININIYDKNGVFNMIKNYTDK